MGHCETQLAVESKAKEPMGHSVTQARLIKSA
jgi:hypothetical protein